MDIGEFDIVVAEIFFERFEFLACSKFNHTHNVAVHVHVLWPVCTHTIPFLNVVASVTGSLLHVYLYVYIYKRCLQNMKHCGRSKALSTEHHGKFLTCKSFVTLGFVSVSVCCVLCVVVVVVEEGGREANGRDQSNHLVADSPPKFPSRERKLNSFIKVKRMIGGIGNMHVLLDLFSKPRDNHTWATHGKQKIGGKR